MAPFSGEERPILERVMTVMAEWGWGGASAEIGKNWATVLLRSVKWLID